MRCAQCGTECPEGFRFCGGCGSPLLATPAGAAGPANQTMYFGEMQQPNQAKLILIKGEGLDGVSYHLAADEHLAGRTEGELVFPDDTLLSPLHAAFYYVDGHLHVRDEGSQNGVFVRISDRAELSAGCHFLVGEQLLRLDILGVPDGKLAAHPSTDEEGTLRYGSPSQALPFHVTQILRGGEIGMSVGANAGQITLGREGSDISFPNDPFISGEHALVTNQEGGAVSLLDLSSKNGTFVRIEKPWPLGHGEYVFLGQQLFRVEVN